MGMNFKRKLPIPKVIKEQFPLSEKIIAHKAERDEEIRKVFTGELNKLLLVIGPCSADREDSVMDYIYKLKDIQEKVKDKIIIIPRIYTNKPTSASSSFER